MALFDHDPETVRKYLLGQLTDGQQQNFQQRLLSEDELTQELDVTTEELVDEYLAKQLTPKESQWFEQHYLASPQGKQSQTFATVFHRYIANNRSEPKKSSWTKRVADFWNRQLVPVRAIAAIAAIAVVVFVAVLWLPRTPAPKSFATLTLANSSITRSGGGALARVRLTEDALRINLLLESPASPGIRYRAELLNGSGQIRTLEPVGQDARSVSVEIPGSWLPKGQYVINLLVLTSDKMPQRIPGNYQFIIE